MKYLEKMLGSRHCLRIFFSWCLALIGFLMILPIFILIAVLVVLIDGRPVFFKQERIGKSGKPFQLYKFRSMKTSAPAMKSQLITIGQDPRITSLGQRLRSLKLDELPQLINVVKGEMTLVGPRPEVSKFVQGYTEEQRKVLEVPPGITDLASIKYSNESELLGQVENPNQYYREIILPDKLSINLEYLQRANIFSDLIVIFKTIGIFPRAIKKEKLK